METIQLYKQNPYQQKFEATVLACHQEKEGYDVILDQTAFFPEGGGQYGDRGFLNDIEVVDTQIKDGIILHKTNKPFDVGTKVCGQLNWERRYSFMQNHSAEHMMSGLIHKTYGYDNVGFHLGEEEMTLDFNGMLSMEQLLELEQQVNEKIWENIPIKESYPTKEEEEQLEYRSKKEVEDALRIITIEGVDCCACCAPHVKISGEIGLVKVISVQKNKMGVRVTMLAGKRAVLDYDKKHEQTGKVGQLLSVPVEQIVDAVKKLQEEKQQLEHELLGVKLLFLQQKAAHIVPENGIACIEIEELSGKEIRELCNYLMEKGQIAVVLNKKEEKEEIQYTIGSKHTDVRAINSLLKETLNGRGGGNAQMVQGTLFGTKEEVLNCIKGLGEKYDE